MVVVLIFASEDGLLGRSQRTVGAEGILELDTANLPCWVDVTDCLAREQTAYLNHETDLMYVATSYQDEVTRLLPLVAEVRAKAYQCLER